MSQLCDRARAWASLRADGELSELESAFLDAHLGRCVDCRSFALSAQTVAAALRSVHLERPAPFALAPARARTRSAVRALQFAAVAAVIVAAGLAASASGPGTARTAKPVVMVAGFDSSDHLRELRRPALVEKGHSLPRNRFVPGVAV